MNVVIGVLGESYDVEHDRARVSFLQSRAGICAEYSSRIWKVQRPLRLYSLLRDVLHVAQVSTPRCLFWLLATLPVSCAYVLVRCLVAEWHCYDYQGHYQEQDTTAPFIWLCVAHNDRGDHLDAEAGRLQIMTNRMDQSLQTIQKANSRAMAVRDEKAAADSARLEKVEQMLVTLTEQLSRLSQRGLDVGSDLRSEDGAQRACKGSAVGAAKCPFSGAPMPAAAFASRPRTESAVQRKASIVHQHPGQPPRADGRRLAPENILHYGAHLACLEQMVVEQHGVDKWHAVKREAGLEEYEDGDFVQSRQFEPETLELLLAAMSKVLGVTVEHSLRAVGVYFIGTYLEREGYQGMLRANGKHLRELMDNMDGMHVTVERSFQGGLAPPSFKTEDAEDGVGFLLHYWSFRSGLWPMVAGQVETCGKLLFNQETKVVFLRQSHNEGVYYALFQVMDASQLESFHAQRQAKEKKLAAPRVNKKEDPHPARPDKQAPPAEALFYGLVNESVEQLIINGFGRDKWHAVKDKAGLSDVEDGDFEKMQQYDQDLTYKVVGAITEILGLSGEDALQAAGDNFVAKYLPDQGYLDLLRAQGSTLREFMGNMDTMHSYLKRETLPGLAPPSFKTKDAEDGEGFLLHYWSFRPGLWPLAKGMVAASGRELFNQETKVEVVKQSEEGGHHYTLFHVKTEGGAPR